MGIGKTAFTEELVGKMLSGLKRKSSKAVVVSGNVYVNWKLGILFHKPDKWGFVAVKDFGILKREQIIGTELDISREEIWEALGEPVCMITKYHQPDPALKGVFSPTITLNVTPVAELREEEYGTFEAVIETSALGTALVLKDFEVLNMHEPRIISGCLFYEFDARYLFEHSEIEQPLDVELKVLKVAHNGFYYDFNCHQSKAQGQCAGAEFEQFISSIRML